MARILPRLLVVFNGIWRFFLIPTGATAQTVGCNVEPPPVLHSYREFDGKGNILYTCKTTANGFRSWNSTTPQVVYRACKTSYSKNDFRFCEYDCGTELPVESGAELVPDDGKGGGPNTDFDLQRKYTCMADYSAYHDYPSEAYAKCDRSSETFSQPSIACYVNNRYWVKGQPARYAKVFEGLRNQAEYATTDEHFRTVAVIGENQPGPEWSCDLDLRKGTGDDDIISGSSATSLPMVEIIAVVIVQYVSMAPLRATVRVSNSNQPETQPQFCQEEVLIKYYAFLACEFLDGHYPIGDLIEIDFVNGKQFIYLNEVIVFGRRWIHSCPAPPPLHGMKLLNFTLTEAQYSCEQGWRQVAEIPTTFCTINRTWKLPAKVCSDAPNLALGKDSGMFVPRSSFGANKSKNEITLNVDTSVLTDGNLDSCVKNISCKDMKSHSLTVSLASYAEIETVLMTYNVKSELNAWKDTVKWGVRVGEKACDSLITFSTLSSNQTGTTTTSRHDCSKLPLGDSVHITIMTDTDLEDECYIDLCEVDVIGYPSTDPQVKLECFRHRPGLDYKGRISVTIGGHPCQAWAHTSPHPHPYTDDVYFADEDVISSGHNYCRFPTSTLKTKRTSLAKRNNTPTDNETHTNYTRTASAPWCYTTDPDVEWEECGVPACAELCAFRQDQADYMGDLSKTKSDKICLKWPGGSSDDADDERRFAFWPDFPDWNHGVDPSKHNFCRNPASSQSKAWCYVDKSGETELCDVPSCPVSPSSLFSSQSISIKNLGQLANYTSFDNGLVFYQGFHSKFSPFEISQLNSVCTASFFGSFVTLYLINVSPVKYFHVVLNCTDREDEGGGIISDIDYHEDESCELDLSFEITPLDLTGKISSKPGKPAVTVDGSLKRKCFRNDSTISIPSNGSVETVTNVVSKENASFVHPETTNSRIANATAETTTETLHRLATFPNISDPLIITTETPESKTEKSISVPTTKSTNIFQNTSSSSTETVESTTSDLPKTSKTEGGDDGIISGKNQTVDEIPHSSDSSRSSSSHHPIEEARRGEEGGSIAQLKTRFKDVLDFLAHATEHRRLENLCSFVADTSQPWCRCPCPCSMKKPDITQGEIDQKIAKINRELRVDPKKVSKQVRSKVSTPDYRPSAIGCGTFAIAIMCVIIACMMAGDLITLAMSILGAVKSQVHTRENRSQMREKPV